MEQSVLVLLRRTSEDEQILIGERERRCGQRIRVNAPGSVKGTSEGLIHCAKKVVRLQTGLTICAPHMREGAIVCIYVGGAPTMQMFVYVVDRFEGTPLESAQMKNLHWVQTDHLPYSRMHAGDEFWMERFFLGDRGTFHLQFDDLDDFVGGKMEDAQAFKEVSW